MLAFIRAQPSIVERLLRHIETPSFVDLLVRIIQLDEQPGGAGVLEVRCVALRRCLPHHAIHSGFPRRTS
jgi:hypothetical protein